MTSESLSTFPRRLATSRRFTLGVPRSFQVSCDGDTVLFLRSDSGHDAINNLWKICRGDPEPVLLFDAANSSRVDISAAEQARRERTREQASGVVSYVVSDDFTHAYFVIAGELVSVSIEAGEVVIMSTAEALFDPRPQRGDGIEARGRLVAYVSDRSLRITDGNVDRIVPGTDESSNDVSWGTAEFVAAEEMGRTRGFWWSPDGTSLVAARVDVGPVQQWWISSPEAPAEAPRMIRYPAAGTDNVGLTLWIIDAESGPVAEIDWRRGEFEYVTSVSWTERLLCAVETRDQQVAAILEVDLDGQTREVARCTDERWVEFGPGDPRDWEGELGYVVDDVLARRLVVGTEVVSTDEYQMRQIIGRIDGHPIVTASTDPTSTVIARIDTDGSAEVLSEAEGVAGGAIGGGTIVVSQATLGAATTQVIRWHDGTTTDLKSVADEPGFPIAPTFNVVTERELRTALCLPSHHDGSKLPVLMDPYGGPHAQRVVRARNAFATSQWFAEQGFAVVVVDGAGTPGRGPVFEREVWGDLAGPVLDDQMAALASLAETHDELDLSRVGIRGWSFGGYLAALAVLRRPDVFHVAVAGAPVTDWLLYDTFYTERYLGHPDEHPTHYSGSSLIDEAHLLERPLMLIHGLADDNVVAAHTLTFSRALLEAGRAHEVLPLSGVTHMTPQELVAENLLHLQRDFLLRHLS